MTDARYFTLLRLYRTCTNEQLRVAAQYLAAAADGNALYRDHWIVVEDIIETRK